MISAIGIMILIISSSSINVTALDAAQTRDNIDFLRSKIDSLENIKERLRINNEAITSQIDSIRQIIILKQTDTSAIKYIITKVKKEAKFRLEPNPSSTIIKILSKGEIVEILDYENHYYKARHNGMTGYIFKHYLKITKDIEMFAAACEQNKLIKEALESRKERKKAIKREEEIKLRKEEKRLINEEEKRKRLIKEKLISRLKEKQNAYESNDAWIKVPKANIRQKPTINSDIVMQLEIGDHVYIQEEVGEWLRVKIRWREKYIYSSEEYFESSYKNGWVHKSLISYSMVEKPKLSKWELIVQRRKEFIQKNPSLSEKTKFAIMVGNILIGMNKEMVIASLGFPDDINKTVTSGNVHEQWIYESGTIEYVYFDNDILTSWQE